MISMFPFICILVWPLLWNLQRNWRQHKLRLFSIYGINFIVLVIASFFPAQRNLIKFSLYLNDRKEIINILRIDDTPSWITEVFIKDHKVQFIDFDADHLLSLDSIKCDTVIVLGSPQLEELKFKDPTGNFLNKLRMDAKFSVNLIEQLSYKLNPKHNRRRVGLNIFRSKQCS